MAAENISFSSPLADAKLAHLVGTSQLDSLFTKLSEISGWAIALTVLLVLVAYDQCMSSASDSRLVLTIPQSVTYGRRAQLLGQHGKPLSSDHSSSQWTQNGPNIVQNGPAVSLVVSRSSTSMP